MHELHVPGLTSCPQTSRDTFGRMKRRCDDRRCGLRGTDRDCARPSCRVRGNSSLPRTAIHCKSRDSSSSRRRAGSDSHSDLKQPQESCCTYINRPSDTTVVYEEVLKDPVEWRPRRGGPVFAGEHVRHSVPAVERPGDGPRRVRLHASQRVASARHPWSAVSRTTLNARLLRTVWPPPYPSLNCEASACETTSRYSNEASWRRD